MRVLGVDPGSVSAAWGLWDQLKGDVAVGDVPVVNRMVNDAAWRAELMRLRPDLVVIEKVGAMPQQGVSSTFKFGFGTGLLRGVVVGLGLPLVDVAPAVWKRALGVGTDAERVRQYVIHRFPALAAELTLKRHHNRAEAFLLAVYEGGKSLQDVDV